MRNLALSLLLVGSLLLSGVLGCGVVLNSGYSDLLNRTAALSNEAATRAEAGTLTPAEMTQALRLNATSWQYFKDGRDGLAPAPTAPGVITIVPLPPPVAVPVPSN
jgi:hypothetical protein